MWDALALLLSAVALGTSHASVVTNYQPTWSPDGKWIAYASDRDGRFDIWKTDGVNVRRVARGGADPAWSPNGKTIAFVAESASTVPGIYTIAASGTAASRRLLAGYGFQPAWSPDGRRIVFTAPTGGCDRGEGIWVMRSDGSGKALVGESPDEFTDYVAPAWSPDGKRIAYAIPNSDQGESGIVTVPAHGEAATPQLVVDRGSEPSWSPDGRRIVYSTPMKGGFGPLFVIDLKTFRRRRLTGMLASGPVWSPGGKRIAFAARATDGSSAIYLINQDGSHLVRLTKPIPSSGPPGTGSDFSDVFNGAPAWSPDGLRIAFVTSRRTGSVPPAPAAVAVIDVDGSGRRTLAPGYSPTWSPDGQHIAYVEEDGAHAYVDVIDADGGNRRRLVHTEMRDIRPDWSPDGGRIAFNDVEDNVARIYVVDVESRDRTLLVSGGGAPDWSHDGSRLMFVSYDNVANRYYLEVVNSDGTSRRRLVIGNSIPWEGPRWSPDDRRIAYSGGPGYSGLSVMNGDGSDAHRIADGYWPSWSPDGTSIAFAGFRQGYEVMTIPATGGVPTRVTYGGCTVVGTDGSDELGGTSRNDVICAFGGKDTITGGPGDDRILGGNDADRVFGGPGRDTIFGEDGADSIDGGPGPDTIRGGNDADAIIADDGEPDLIDGGEGIDCATTDTHDRLLQIEHRSCPRPATTSGSR